ncbi:unnamed protein product, partial [marine sediment metagenome]
MTNYVKNKDKWLQEGKWWISPYNFSERANSST